MINIHIYIVSLYNRLIGKQNLKKDVLEYYAQCRKMCSPEDINDTFMRRNNDRTRFICVNSSDHIPSLKVGKDYFDTETRNMIRSDIPKYKNEHVKLMIKYVCYLSRKEMDFSATKTSQSLHYPQR